LLGFPLAGADWSGAVVAYVWCASAITVDFLITTLMHRPRCRRQYLADDNAFHNA
jgi:heme exporter protein D